MENTVTFNDGFYEVSFALDGIEHTYEIPSRELKDPESLVRWIRQLTEKRWCNNKIITDLIACAYSKWGKLL